MSYHHNFLTYIIYVYVLVEEERFSSDKGEPYKQLFEPWKWLFNNIRH